MSKKARTQKSAILCIAQKTRKESTGKCPSTLDSRLEQELLAGIAKTLSLDSPLKTKILSILKQINKSINAHLSIILTPNENTGELKTCFSAAGKNHRSAFTDYPVIATQVYKSGEAESYTILDLNNYLLKHKRSKNEEQLESAFICLPIKYYGQTLGVFYIEYRRDPGMGTVDHDILIIEYYLARLSLLLNKHIAPANTDDEEASTDLERILQEELSKTGETGSALSLLLIDLQIYKNFNQRYGKIDGGFLSRQTFNSIQHTIRETDQCIACSEDIYAVILRGTGLVEGKMAAERLSDTLGKLTFKYNSVPIRPSIRIGLASSIVYTKSSSSLIGSAHRALQLC